MRKATSIFLYVLIGLAAIGGLNVVFGWFNSQPIAPDWTKAQVAAEQFTRLYLTADDQLEQREAEIMRLAPGVTKLMASTKESKQTVSSVRARQPYWDVSDQMVIEVDAWALAQKKGLDPQTKKQVTEWIPRKFLVSVRMAVNEEDPYKGYTVLGWPKVWEQNVGETKLRKMDDQLNTVRESISPLVRAVVPLLYKESQHGIENYLLEGTEPKSFYSKNLEAPAVKEVFVSSLEGGSYFVEVKVSVKDKLLGTQLIDRVSLEVIEKDKKYFVKTFY
ncbi:conjugal transfer protein [Paenibacillus melissococcoides]|uniref:Conjugal transfer protein n=1 Tax=Paenibacillus melissococcoides TaxID=2912268 RepID=A0ABN8UEB1_9BACL|nr:conjugal transfer protein [Paenibacillus melissococcoides]CAH8248465.1 conjugal transfer protein [Paenibacillus melissococcoides]CAH8722126.1 conjugal transfer protein [Paenibacillus melissococcoides]CAH8722143.1 conjugal transfer protein [Paenibacillus melissococcoides]